MLILSAYPQTTQQGIYSKDNSSTKARGHALLMSERPYCVNILTLGKSF